MPAAEASFAPQHALYERFSLSAGSGGLAETRQAGVVEAAGFEDLLPDAPDLRFYVLTAMRLEALVRSFLVRIHQARVAGDIGGEDGGETAGCGHSSGIPARRRPAK
jgi:hypothetical protein